MDAPPRGNGDGLLSLPEFTAGIEALGVEIRPREIQELFDCLDFDADRKLDCRDFVQGLCIQRARMNHEKLVDMDGMLDARGNVDPVNLGLGGLRMRAIKRLLEAWDPEMSLFVGKKGSESKRQKLKKLFEKNDPDGLGFISAKAFHSLLIEAEPTLSDAQIAEIFKSMDWDRSNTIHYKEFASVLGEYQSWVLAVQQIQKTIFSGKRQLYSKRIRDTRDLFIAMDRRGNNNQVMELEEFIEGMTRLGIGLSQKVLTDVFEAMDVDASGYLEIEEFLHEIEPKGEHKVATALRVRRMRDVTDTWSQDKSWFSHKASGILALFRDLPGMVATDGTVGSREFQRAMSSLDDSLQIEEIDLIYDAMDLERQHKIRFRDLSTAIGAYFGYRSTIKELKTVLAEAKIEDQSSLVSVIEAIDMPPMGNGDGLLSCDELGKGHDTLGLNVMPQRLSEMFKQIDVDESGCIDAGELLGALGYPGYKPVTRSSITQEGSSKSAEKKKQQQQQKKKRVTVMVEEKGAKKWMVMQRLKSDGDSAWRQLGHEVFAKEQDALFTLEVSTSFFNLTKPSLSMTRPLR